MKSYTIREENLRGIFFEKRPNVVPYYVDFLGANNQVRQGEVIITEGRLKKLAKKMMKLQEFAYDTETNTLRVQAVGEMKLVGISISWGEFNNYYVPVFHAFDKYTLPLETVVKYLKPCFQREDVRIIGHNLKYDLHVLANVDMEIKTKDIFDTMVGRWITDENESKGLKEVTSSIYDIPQTHFDECLTTVTKAERKYLGLSTTAKYIPFYATRIKNGAPYAIADAYWTWRHYADWEQDLIEEEKMQTIYRKGSMPFLLTLYGMERRGVNIDKDRLIRMKAQAEKDLEELEYAIYEIAEVPFQISSPQQLAEILFGYKKFNKAGEFSGNTTLVENSFNYSVVAKTNTGIPKTGDDELKALCKKTYKKDKRKQEGIEMVKLIRKHKKLSKLYNAFIVGLIEQAYEDGKIHPTYNQCGCLTKETLIPTNKGLVPIGKLADLGKDGEFVEKELTITNRYREDELTKYVVKYENRETTKIETTLGYTIEGTNNHPIIKNKYNSTELTNNIGGCRLKGLYKGAEEWARLDSLTTNDYVAVPYGYNTFSEDLVELKYDNFHSSRAKSIKLPKYLNEELAEFIGIYQADGSIYDNNGTYSIRITNGNKSVINRVQYLSKQLFNVEAKTILEPKKRSATTYITSLNLKVIEKALELKRKDVDKVVPNCILKSPKEIIVAYLKGLTLDSCVIVQENKTYLKYTFANELTARYVQEILLNLGIISARSKDKSKSDNVNHILVYNSEYNTFKNLIGFIEPEKYVEGATHVKPNYRRDVESKTLWLKVRSIEKSQADVYDFNVPETHSFISGAFISHNTDSGRLSCSNPNLQQLPRPIEMDDPTSFADWYEETYKKKPTRPALVNWDKVAKHLKMYKDYPTGELDVNLVLDKKEKAYLEYLKDWFNKNEENVYWKFYEIRACFIPDDLENQSLIALDFSNLEMRLLAHFSEDPYLMETFIEDHDAHGATAVNMFALDCEPDQAKKKYKPLRQIAKTLNFLLMYGGSAGTLFNTLDGEDAVDENGDPITKEKAQEYYDKYFEAYSGVADFIKNQKRFAHKHGCVYSVLGRKRRLHDINSHDYRTVAYQERLSVNSAIQGSGGDIMMMCQPKIENDPRLIEMGCTMRLQVHDEVVLNCPDEHLEEATKIVKNYMEHALPKELNIPLRVDSDTGKSYAEAK